MVVATHKNKRVYLHIEPFAGLPQGFEKHLPVLTVIEDISPLVPSRKDMVICTVVLNSPGSRHLHIPVDPGHRLRSIPATNSA